MSSPAPPGTPPQQRNDNQLRDSVRKIRKRVVSVIRRGSKTGKSRSTSVEPGRHDRGTSTSTEHVDDDKHHDDEHHDDENTHYSVGYLADTQS